MATQLAHTVESGELVQLQLLKDELTTIRSEMVELETNALAEQFDLHESQTQSARNLLHYLSLRRRDLRPLQDQLAALGLSSLGRAESHVKANVDIIGGVIEKATKEQLDVRITYARTNGRAGATSSMQGVGDTLD